MSHELLHVFEDADGQGLLNGRKVVEEFREGSAMFKIVEQCPNRYTCTYENGRPPRMSKSESTPGIVSSMANPLRFACSEYTPSFPDRPLECLDSVAVRP